MSDTPRVDAAAVSREFIAREMDHYAHKFVLADFARQLERELAEAQRKLEVWSLRYAGLEVLYLAAMKS